MMDLVSKKYKKTFINKVIVRIDFLQFAETVNVFCDDVEKSILKFFPSKGKEQILRFNSIDLVFDSEKASVSNPHRSTQEGAQREYYSSNKKNKVILSNKYIIFEINDYSTFDELKDWLKSVFISFFLKNHTTVVRTGIRYINLIEADKIKPRKNMFSPEISASLNTNAFSLEEGFKLIRSMHQTEYLIDQMRLNFKYGLYNPQYPNELLNNSFALDYDCFSEEQIESAEGVLQCLEKGHTSIQTVFESSISDILRKVMDDE